MQRSRKCRRQRRAAAVLLAGGLALAGGAGESHAQNSPQGGQSTAGPGKSGAIEEIVVMARKREESLQETPVSITAFTADMLQSQGITDLEDIGEATPNLLFDMNASSYNPRVYIRGVGSDDQILTIDPAVGVYVDGVYMARTFGLNLDVMDIERVEVLRGPQGTLYGRNTIGGAINLTSVKPSGEMGATIRANLGSQRRSDLGVALDVPLLPETLAARFTFASQYDEGYFKNRFAGDSNWTNDRGLSGRASFLLTPGYDTSFQLILDRAQKRSHPAGVNLNSVCETATSSFCAAGFAQATLGLLTEGSRRSGTLNSGTGSVYAEGAQPADRSDNHVDSTGVSLISTFGLSEATELKLISSGRWLETRESLDIDGTALSYVDLLQHNDNFQASQEFQLGTRLFDDRIDWISGVYLFYEDTKFEIATHTVGHDTTAFQAPLVGTTGACGVSPTGVTISCASAGLLSSNTRTDQRTLSYAGYTHMEFDLTDRLQLEGGLRYTYDHKLFKSLVRLKIGTAQTNVRDTEHWDDWSPMVGLNYQLTDDVLLYARWSRGFRGGQFNGRANATTPATLGTVDPETVKVSEIGLKSIWMDNRLIFNLAAFRNNYTDQQLTSFTTNGSQFVSIVQNAGKSRILGAEAEVNLRAADGLDLFGSIGVLDAKYQTFREQVCPALPSPPMAGCALPGGVAFVETDVSNRDFKNMPELSFNVGGEYSFQAPLVPGWMSARLDYSHTSQVYFSTNNTESIRQDKVGLLNGRLAWANDAGTMEVALWGRNLTNRNWDVFGLDLDSSLGFTTTYPAPPFEGGIELTLRY